MQRGHERADTPQWGGQAGDSGEPEDRGRQRSPEQGRKADGWQQRDEDWWSSEQERIWSKKGREKRRGLGRCSREAGGLKT